MSIGFTTHADESKAIIYTLNPGKPDPLNPARRVVQPAQKGLTCSLYAMHRIRVRHAKNSTAPGRIAEKQISVNRKKATVLSQGFLLEKGCVQAISGLTTEKLKRVLAEAKTRSEASTDIKLINQKLIFDKFINDYLTWNPESKLLPDDKLPNNTKDGNTVQSEKIKLELFLDQRFLEKSVRLYDEALRSYKMPIENLEFSFEFHIDYLTPGLKKELTHDAKRENASIAMEKTELWKHVNLHYKSVILHGCAISREAELYGLQSGIFNFGNITTLIAILNMRGPIVISGPIGKAYYPKNTEKAKKINNKEVYSFPPDTYKTEGVIGHHYVVLTGASQSGYANTTQDLVYYSDPNDESIPGKEDKTYILSYKSFSERAGRHKQFYHEGNKIKETAGLFFFKPKPAAPAPDPRITAAAPPPEKTSICKKISGCVVS